MSEVNRSSATGSSPTAMSLAAEFHRVYEMLAPQYGYETRKDTKEFDPTSPNGRLMTAVCAYLLKCIPSETESTDAKDAARYRWLNRQHNFVAYIENEKRERTHMRLRCGVPLDEWIDARIAEEKAAPQAQFTMGDPHPCDVSRAERTASATREKPPADGGDVLELAKYVLHYYGWQPSDELVAQWLYKLAHEVYTQRTAPSQRESDLLAKLALAAEYEAGTEELLDRIRSSRHWPEEGQAWGYLIDESTHDTLQDGSAAAAKKLDKPALIGNTRFGVGVSERLVINRAQREHEYRMTPDGQWRTPSPQPVTDHTPAVIDLIHAARRVWKKYGHDDSGSELDWSEWQDVKEAIAALDGTAPAQQEKKP